jgi:hypothetical protein
MRSILKGLTCILCELALTLGLGEFARGDTTLEVRMVAQHLRPVTGLFYLGNRVQSTLTLDGDEILVSDSGNKLSLFAVSDLTERIVTRDPRFQAAWTDSQTGGVFVTMIPPNEPVLQIKGPSPKHFDLLYFQDIPSLINWKPNWTRKQIKIQNASLFLKSVQWIEGAQLFAFCDGSKGMAPTTTTELIDTTGKIVGEFETPGCMIGMDSCDDGLEVYFSSCRENAIHVLRGVVNRKRDKLESLNELYVLDKSELMRLAGKDVAPLRSLQISFFGEGTRKLRFRGAKIGDMGRFVTEVLPNPEFWDQSDIPELPFDERYLRITVGHNVLAAAETDSEFLSVHGKILGPTNRCLLANRRGEFISFSDTVQGVISDAACVNGRWVVVTCEQFQDNVVGAPTGDNYGVRVWTLSR